MAAHEEAALLCTRPGGGGVGAGEERFRRHVGEEAILDRGDFRPSKRNAARKLIVERLVAPHAVAGVNPA